jgi:hypothetical protein
MTDWISISSRSPDGANGSRECAPDDKLREIRGRLADIATPDCAEPVIARRFTPTRSLHPGLSTRTRSGSSDLPVGRFGVESFISDFPKNICSL